MEIAKKNLTPIEKSRLECLESVLKHNDIPEYYYGLKGFGDDRVCLEKDKNGAWIVYYGSRGKKTDLKNFPNFLAASQDFIDRFTVNATETNRICRQLHLEIRKKMSRPPSKVSKVHTSKADPVPATHALVSKVKAPMI